MSYKPQKGKKTSFYAVRKGRKPGIYSTWDECQAQVNGFSGAVYEKFNSAVEAERFISGKAPSWSTRSPAATTSVPKATVGTISGKKRTPRPVVEDESGWDVAYTDGACKGNGKAGSIAGIGVWWGPNDPRNRAERCPGDQTNNRAELIAVVRLLETTTATKRPLLIKTDSQYTIDCFTLWLPNWRKNKFRTSTQQKVKNEGIIRYLSALLDVRAHNGQQVRFQYVKGHSGEPGNDGADYLANQGALLPVEEDRDWVTLRKALLKANGIQSVEDAPSDDDVLLPFIMGTTPSAVAVGCDPADISDELAEHPKKRKLSSSDSKSSSEVTKRSKQLDDARLPSARPASTSSSSSRTSFRYPPSIQSSLPKNGGSQHHSTVSSVSYSSRESRSSTTPSKSSASVNAPPVVQASENDINLEDYADGLLSDEDLAKELES